MYRAKSALTILTVLGLVFVGFGDKVLPQPWNTASYNTRITVNNYLINLFPTRKPKNPYERTEKAIDNLNQKQKQ